MRNALLALSFVTALVLGVAGWFTFTAPDAPIREAFERPFVRWWIERAYGRESTLDDTLEGLADYRQIQHALLKLERTFDEPNERRAAVRQLNDSILAEGGDVFVEYMMENDVPLVQTFTLVRRTRIADAAQSDHHVIASELRRLDHTNLVAYFTGRADEVQPSVFLDRLEASAVYALKQAGDKSASAKKTNAVDHAATDVRRAYWDTRTRPGLFDAMATFVHERSRRLDKMEKRLAAQRVRIDEPERLVFGEAFFDSLQPYSEALRPGGPLIFSRDLDDLARFDASHEADAASFAAVVMDVQGRNAAAQSSYRALFTPPGRRMENVPAALLRWVGDDSESWALSADASLRGALGGAVNTTGSPCLMLAGLAVSAQGARRRSTDRYFAANAIVEGLHGGPVSSRDDVAALVREACADEDALRVRLADVHQALYGAPVRRLTQTTVFPVSAP